MQLRAPDEWTDADDIREAGEARYQRQQLDFRVEAWLWREGWKHTSDTPGCFWMWQRALPDGRVVLVDRAMAISLTEHWPEGQPTDAGTVTASAAVPSGCHEVTVTYDGNAGTMSIDVRPVGSAGTGADTSGEYDAEEHAHQVMTALLAEAPQADAIKAAVARERERFERALELLHRYVDGLPPQKPTSIDGDTQAFLAEVDSGADAPGAGKDGGK